MIKGDLINILDNKYTISIPEAYLTSMVGSVKKVKIFSSAGTAILNTTDGPTNNCQLSIIASFVNLFFIKDDKEIYEIIKTLHKNLPLRKIILVDVNRNISTRVKSIFTNQIISDTPYTSTNGSMMNIILINGTLL